MSSSLRISTSPRTDTSGWSSSTTTAVLASSVDAMNYVVADNYLCFLALLEMILREKGARITQYDLAEMTSVVIPEGYSVRINNVRYSTCQDDYGVSVTPPTLRKIFSELGISIDVLYLDALRINEFELDKLLQ